MWIYRICVIIGTIQAIYCIGNGIWEALTNPGQRYRTGFYTLGSIGNGVITALFNFCALCVLGGAIEKVWSAFQQKSFETIDFVIIAVFAIIFIVCVRKAIIHIKKQVNDKK